MATADTVHVDPYASRINDQWKLLSRQDPVVWCNDAGPLSVDQLRSYSDAGFLALPELISQGEAEQLLEEAERLAERADPDAVDVISEPDSRAIRSLFRLHRANEMFQGLCKSPRIAGIARQILGTEVYIHQSRINFKPPFCGKEFFWHSDFETWHVEDGMPRMRAVSISISLTENSEFNGPLMLVDGSHQRYVRCAGATPDQNFRNSLRKQEIGVPSREALQTLVEAGKGIVAPKGLPGSATVFDCNTMHGSVSNLSPYPRTNFFVVFNSVENALVEPFSGQAPRPDFLGERDIVPITEL
jgi:ectoine hydroxylase